jgi:hypothetical protein
MSKKIVMVKGSISEPEKFWNYIVVTPEEVDKYIKKGFVLSDKKPDYPFINLKTNCDDCLCSACVNKNCEVPCKKKVNECSLQMRSCSIYIAERRNKTR